MLPWGLSMLWESEAPDVALQRRFGFQDFATATQWIAGMLEETWGIGVHDCSRIVISSHNAIAFVRSTRGGLVLKWSRAGVLFPRLDFCTRLLGRLARRDVPVVAPIPTIDAQERVVVDGPAAGLSVAVLPEVPGDWLDVGDERAVHSAGVSLARLHRALGTESMDGVPVAARTGLGERVEDWLNGVDHTHAPEALRRLEGLLSAAPELDDEAQLLHGDYRAANILTRDSAVVAVLDFDDVEIGARVDDLARAGVYLGTRFHDWQPTPRVTRQTFRKGYESVRPLSSAEDQWLEIATLWYGLGAIPMHGTPKLWAAAL
ncbi:MAG: phosphotransferase [Propionibacteriaceae bacterium]